MLFRYQTYLLIYFILLQLNTMNENQRPREHLHEYLLPMVIPKPPEKNNNTKHN